MENRIELYHKTEDILFQAYFNDTLEHRKCGACAVGNIIAGNLGAKIPELGMPVYRLPSGDLVGVPWLGYRASCPEKQLNANEVTGYNNRELELIESAFELANHGDNRENYMFNGLVAVLETLKDIHGITQEQSMGSKQRFEHHYHSLQRA